MEHLPEWCWFAGGVVLVVLGVLAGAWTVLGDVRRVVAARHWPGVEGLVTRSAVEATGSGEDRFEKHIIFYRYEVKGVTYTGKRVHAGGDFDLTIFGGADRSWSTAQFRQATYPPGTAVYVLYNPAAPGDCCLDAGGLGNAVVEVAASLALIVAGAYLIVTHL